MTASDVNNEYDFSIIAKAYGHFFGDKNLFAANEDWLVIADTETFDIRLLQVNNEDAFPEELRNCPGAKCYKALKGRDTPCENCNAGNANRYNYFVRIDNDNPFGKDLFTKEILIDLDGRPCMLQAVTDLTDQKRRDEVINAYLMSRNVMANVLSQLMDDKPIEKTFMNILREIGNFFDADRVLITNFQNLQNNATWTKDGRAFNQICTKLSAPKRQALAEATRNLRYIWIPDIRNADKIDDKVKAFWLAEGIESILFLPMQYNGEFIGTLSLHNFKAHSSEIDTLNLISLSIAKALYSKTIETTSELQLYTDPLTGALNLSGLKKHAYDLLTEHPENNYCFCICDIRYFSGINRKFSYDLGDKILNKTAETLYEMLDDDEAYCRIAADQFCFLAKFKSETDFKNRFDLFVRKMQCFPVLSDANYKIEYQAGVYLPQRSDNTISISRAIDKANIARRTLKDFHGSGLAFFNTEMLEKSKREIDLIQDFKAALENDEISVYYQPQCRYVTKDIAGAEALVRWNSPKHGYISPAEFIPVLEKNGLIYDLDKHVWEIVCKQQRKLMDKGHKCPISINVSRYDVLKAGMCNELCALLNKYNIPKELIPLEITETAYIKSSNELINVVNTLKGSGFIVEMDDFGSGYSSLNALKDVAVDLLKLDMKFLDTSSEQGRGGSILNSVVRMTRWLDLPVLAEGVETREQAEYLKNIGCDLMQGYYFARPMPAEEFEKILDDNRSSSCFSDIDSQLISASAFMESIIKNPEFFNHIGAAAIIEYYNKECEALLINDNFLEMLDCTREEYNPFMKHMHMYSIAIQKRADAPDIFERIVSGVNTHDFKLRRKDGTLRNTRMFCRNLLSDNDRHIMLLTLDDLSKYNKI